MFCFRVYYVSSIFFFSEVKPEGVFYSFTLYICIFTRVTLVLYRIQDSFSLLIFGFHIIDRTDLHFR